MARSTNGRFSEAELVAFIDDGEEVRPSSDDVIAAQYHRDRQVLRVTFKRGNRQYAYVGVSEEVATQFALAPSKGGFVHDVFIAEGWNFMK